MLVPRPTTLEQYTLQPEIVKKILRYATQPSILHTVLCGPNGCGKYSLCLLLIAQHMGVSLAELHRVQPHSFTFQDKEHTFYKSAHHFEIDVQHFQPHHQKAIVEIVRDLSKTMNVALNRYKIIVLRNSECLTRNVQHQLRRIVETLYRTAYKMVLHKRGDVARDMVLDILRKLSLVQSREKFTLVTRLFKSVFDYSERVWVPKAKVPMLSVAAAALYERPVAIRWRRVRRAVKWIAIASLTLRELHERVVSKK